MTSTLVNGRGVGAGGSGSTPVPERTAEPVLTLPRRTIDAILIGLAGVLTVVLVVAGSLLTWGANFANDKVHSELAAQKITFSDAATLKEQGRSDLVKYAGQQVDTGAEAKAYASLIQTHLYGDDPSAPTYAEMGTPEREAKAAVEAAQEEGASASEIAALQAKAGELTAQRDRLFKGETLRGLLLSTYAWGTIGRIGGIAALVSFVAAAVMLVGVLVGTWHHHRVVHHVVRS